MIKKVVLVNLITIFAGLLFLCALDLIFVFFMNEEESLLNDVAKLIATLPFISTYLVYGKLKTRTLAIKAGVLSLNFLLLAICAFLEYLWVATHFHLLIGGSI